MSIYKVYVRGHGGEEKQKFPPSELISIDLITLGQFGCTMSDEVADKYIFEHFGIEQIEDQIEKEIVIYWTKAERDDWYDNRILTYTKPSLTIHPYETLNLNLALDGDNTIGQCGVCYWNESTSKLVWIIDLKDKETILLTEILEKLKSMLNEGDRIQLYWTACMSAEYWFGSKKKVSFNPTK